MAVGFAATATNGANAMLDTWGGSYSWLKLHTGDPGSAGTTNAATNTTRKQATWSAASGGLLTNSNTITWDDSEVTTTETYTHYSVWTASTAGTFGGSGTVSGGGVNASGQAFSFAVGAVDITLNVAA